MKPSCLEPYIFDSELCKCVKKRTIKKKCPEGKILNVKTNRCIKEPKKESIKKTKKCPEGKILNVKTNRCINAQKSKKKLSLVNKHINLISIKSNTPIIQQTFGNEIAKELSLQVKSPIKKGKRMETILTAFSPLINQQLVSKIKGKPKGNIIECIEDKKKFNINKPPKIMIDGKCIDYFSPKSQKFLLDRLKYTNKNLKTNDVTAPKQIDSNCWFNCLFMIFFISNKGRKFFKYLRQLMIQGKDINGEEINPKLRNVLARFNLAIEHSMTHREDIIDTYDTNKLIQGIYDSIPISFKKKNKEIKKRGQSGNPLSFYFSLMSYLNYSYSLNIKHIKFWYNYDINMNGNIEESVYEKINVDDPPEIIVVELIDHISIGYEFDKKELVLPSNKNIKYKLDSAVVRDTKQNHFCALLEIGDNECGFDGVSFRKLSNFKWKQNLGKNKNFTFEGSNWEGTNDKIIWNFRDGYYILFYYRI